MVPDDPHRSHVVFQKLFIHSFVFFCFFLFFKFTFGVRGIGLLLRLGLSARVNIGTADLLLWHSCRHHRAETIVAFIQLTASHHGVLHVAIGVITGVRRRRGDTAPTYQHHAAVARADRIGVGSGVAGARALAHGCR